MNSRQKRLRSAKQIFAANVQALLDKHDPKRYGQIHRFAQAHKRIPLSKLQRAVKDGSVNLETVEQIALATGVEPYQLFIEKLDVTDPQIAFKSKWVEAALKLVKDMGQEEK